MRKRISVTLRVLLTITMLFPVLVSFGQIDNKKDSSRVSPDIVVTLLGTGTPLPIMERFGPSILVQAGSETLLFDAGRGCLQRMRQLNVGYNKIDALFFTHLHSDHIVGLADLWLTGWIVSDRTKALNVFGPSGTNDMINYLQKAFAFDLYIRVEDDKKTAEGSKLLPKEIEEGTIYEKNGVKVIAFKVDHHPLIPAFGYRIEYNGHSVVLSGDTRYSENLINFAKGTDLLIHEVIVAPDTITKANPIYARFAHHTTPEQAARVFSLIKPKLAVYSHIAKIYGRTDEELFSRTKANYSGEFIVGEDLMSFSVGDSVSVKKWQNK